MCEACHDTQSRVFWCAKLAIQPTPNKHVKPMLPLTTLGVQAIVAITPPNREGVRHNEHYWALESDPAQDFSAMNARGYDIYYTVGGFEDVTGKGLSKYKGRKRENCVEQRSLFIDLDLKDYDGYAVPDLLRLLYTCTSDNNLLPPTTIVDTGGGIHAYWIATESIPLPTWQAMALTLSAACKSLGLRIDSQCTVDRCRILRVPGFTNHKYGKRVSVVFAQDTAYDIGDIAAMLQPWIATANIQRIANNTKPNPLGIANVGGDYDTMGVSSAFKDAIEVSSWVKLRDASTAGSGCNVIRWVMANQSMVRYGLWTGVLSLAKHTDSATDAITDTCSKHPDFDIDTCVNKAASFSGPRRCEVLEQDAIESGLSNACSGCPFKGKIGTPLTLGMPSFSLQRQTDVVTQLVPAAAVDGTLTFTATQVTKRALPFPYTRIEGKQGVYQLERSETDPKKWVPGDEPVIDVDITVLLVREGADGVVAMYEYMHPMQGLRQFSIPTALLASIRGDGWVSTLTNNFINMSRGAIDNQWRARVSRFLSTLATEYTDKTRAAATVEQFGPIKGEEATTFVYGNTCYRAGQAPHEVVLAEDIATKWVTKMARPVSTQQEHTARREDIAYWNQGLSETIGGRAFGPDKFVLMTGFACALAPFIAPARQRGGLIIPNSTEAGSGKTSMVARAVQMYVSGDEGFVIPDATKMAFLEKNVAVAGALPVVWDEMITRDERGYHLLQDIALSSTNRKPRERLTGTQTEVSWQSWFYATSNPDPHECLGLVSGSNNGAAARIMNIKVHKSRFGVGGDMLRRQRAENEFNDWCKRKASAVGQAWIQHFMQHIPRLRERYIYWGEQLLRDCPSAYDDAAMRFMTTIVVSTMTAAEEAKQIGLHPFDVNDIYAYAITMLGHTVEKADDVIVTSERVLADLLNTSIDVMLVQDSRNPLRNRVPNKEVGLRIDYGASNMASVMLSYRYAQDWCARRNIAFDVMHSNLVAVGAERKNIRMVTGTNLAGMAVSAYVFSVPRNTLEVTDLPTTGELHETS